MHLLGEKLLKKGREKQGRNIIEGNFTEGKVCSRRKGLKGCLNV
jgi:hypothetical protein